MSDAFDVTTEEMMAAARDVATANEEITAVLNSLQSTVGGVAGLWGGQAARAFEGLMQSVDDAGQKINKALDDIGANIAGSGEEYARIEEEQTSSISGLGGRLEGL